MHDLGDKRGIFEEKMCDFCVNEEFSKRKRVIFFDVFAALGHSKPILG